MGLKKQTLQPGPRVPGSSAGWVGGWQCQGSSCPPSLPPAGQGTAPLLCLDAHEQGRGGDGDPGAVLVSVGLNTSVPSSVPCETGTVTSQRCSGVLRGHQGTSPWLCSCSGLGRAEGWQWEKPCKRHALPVSPSLTAVCSRGCFCGQEGKGNTQTSDWITQQGKRGFCPGWW